MKAKRNKIKFFWTGSAIILSLLFMFLKLFGVIAWSWVVVCLPAIIVAGCWFLLFILIIISYFSEE